MHLRFFAIAGLALTAVAGCGDDGGRCGGRGEPRCTVSGDGGDASRMDTGGDVSIPERCSASAQCNDGVECTSDSCSPAGMCRFDPDNMRCPPGQTCAATGCMAPPECMEDSECNDNKTCTTDRCTIEGCTYERNDAQCMSVGFGSVCNPDMVGSNTTTGCTMATGCEDDGDCDDMTACTVDRCTSNRCTNTADNTMCGMGMVCFPGTGCREQRDCTTMMDCDDGNFCNGDEVCVAEFGCAPAMAMRTCRDTEMCTRDSCSTSMNMCVYECDPSISGCTCGTPMGCDPRFNGTFTLSPAPTYSCNGDEVNYNLGTVDLICSAGMLSVLAHLPTTAREATLTQMGTPSGMTFDTQFVVEGDCAEVYRLMGTFSDADHFSGTFSFTIRDPAGLCGLLSDCANQSTSVTGTRM